MMGPRRRQIQQGNLFVDFVVELLAAQGALGRWAVLEHPEDLGRRSSGVPASIWRWPAVRRLAEQDKWQTGALLQSSWGRAFAKPTRFVYCLPGFAASLFAGWPSFDDEGFYVGPLPRLGAPEVLIGKKGSVFKTLSAAAWPSELCRELARCMWAAWSGFSPPA